MTKRVALLFAGLSLAGCVDNPWRSGTYNVAPVSVATAQLVPTVSEETVNVAPASTGVETVAATTAPVESLTAVDGGSALKSTSIADAQLVAAAPTGTSVVAPIAPTGAVGLRNTAVVAAPAAVPAATSAPVAPPETGTVVAVTPPAETVLATAPAPAPETPASAAPAPTAPPAATPEVTTYDAASPAVAFALTHRNRVGRSIYSRGGEVVGAGCNGYRSGLAAQEAFLIAGGPESDELGLDPDGDGYACDFDPTPYRQAARN